VELAEVAVTGVKSTAPFKTSAVDQSLGETEARILHLGGLTILDEGQYIFIRW
jgi:hypothetical protein